MRPRNVVPPVVVPIKLTLHPGLDDDLIDWFTGTPPRLRSAAVKAALRGSGVKTADAGAAPDDTFARLDSLIN